MIGYVLDNVQDYKSEFGDKFNLPQVDERMSLKAGDIVKLIFRFEDDESDLVQVERMWVVVKSASGGRYVGILDNEPYTKGGVKLGDLVKFSHENVLDIYRE